MKNNKRISNLFLAFLLSIIGEMRIMPVYASLPSYVDIHKSDESLTRMLKAPSADVTFPLSTEDIEIIELLTEKFRQEKNCAGLAAPQIGFHKKIIIFAVQDTEELRKKRTDITQTMAETLWINPSYQGIGKEKVKDKEGCFSVEGYIGHVKRFKKISYKAYDREGSVIQGVAEGFLARVIQHEVDHVNGYLYIEKAEDLMTLHAYNKQQAQSNTISKI